MCKRIFCFLLVCCLATSAAWATDNRFVGEWKLNPSRSKLVDQMKVESLGANKYAFDFGGGAETIVVDGTEQPGIGGTQLAVSVEGPDAWKVVRKKDGRMFITALWKLSKDGKTLTDDFTSVDAGGATSNVVNVYNRRAASSGFAGTWVSTIQAPPAFVFRIQSYGADGLSFISPSQGTTSNMKLDGKDYPQKGPNLPEGFASSLHRVNEHTLEGTNKLNGKVVVSRRLEISSDNKTLTITQQIPDRAEPNILVFERQ